MMKGENSLTGRIREDSRRKVHEKSENLEEETVTAISLKNKR